MSVLHILLVVVGSISAAQGYLHVPGMQKLPTPVDHLLRGGPGKPNVASNQKDTSWDEFPENGMGGWFWHDLGPNSAKKTTSTSSTKSFKNMDVIPHGKVGRSYHFDYVPKKMDSLSVWDNGPGDSVPKGKISHWNSGAVESMPKGKSGHWSRHPKDTMPKVKVSHWKDSPEDGMPKRKSSQWNDSPVNNMPNSKISHWNDSPVDMMPKGNIGNWNDISVEKSSDWNDFPRPNADEWDDVMPTEKTAPWSHSSQNSMSDEWSEIPPNRRVKVYSPQQPMYKSTDDEGRMGPQEDRIVGGRDVQDGEVPWQVSLQRRSMRTGKIYHICGGSIINREWIVTAAHCVALALMSNYRVVSGTSELDDENRVKGRSHSHTIHKVVDAHIHHAYDMFRFRNDIALLKVSPQFDIGGSVSAISLPSPGAEFGGQAVASGWGLMQEGVRITPSRLQTVVLPLWSDDKCKEVYGNNVADTMICAGYEQGGKSVCQGDSGGPLFKGTTLIGVVSWGVGCARPGKPGVYTEVSHYINWIERITGGH